MDDSKLLIIGAGGQLGKALQIKYPNAQAVDYQELDIGDRGAVEKFDWSNITHILNAAAYTNVDGAESEEGRVACWKVNASAVANLARVAQKHAIVIAHISTDYVFDGTQETHSENEPFSPISVYGEAKAAGDIAVSTAEKHYILRTSWVIGDGKNFVRSIMGLADKDVSPKVVHDQYGRLTFTSELVKAVDHLITHSLPFGTYNISNSGDVGSWADIAREIYSVLGKTDLTVSNTTAKEYFANLEHPAERPTYSTLDLSKIQSTGFESTDWKDELLKYIQGESR